MLWGRSEREHTRLIERVLLENRDAVFGSADDTFRILQLSVSRPLHRREDRYHRALTVTYATSNGMFQKDLWLKYRSNFEKLYEIQKQICSQMQDDRLFFPRPYFYAEFDGYSLIGMERVKGVVLRNLLLRKMISGQIGSLSKVFYRMGRGMRLFHDSSQTSGVIYVNELARSAHNATIKSQHLTVHQKEQLLEHIKNAKTRASPQTELTLMKIHGDWILRNIMVRENESFYVVDLDSMRAPDNSRWYDVTYFLINLESQLKYWPIISKLDIANLWNSFFGGYLENGTPESLSTNQISAVIYMIKVQYLLGATSRPPLFNIYGKFLGRAYVERLRQSMMHGEWSLFDCDH